MKIHDDTEYIKHLISEGEHVHQDFKYEISDSRKIARTLSAFANTEGGRLLIGVRDNGSIAGVRSEEEMYMVDAAAKVYCEPEVDVAMKTCRVDGHTVLVASVDRSWDRPVMVRDIDGRRLAYVRIADENILATPVHLGVWRLEARNSAAGQDSDNHVFSSSSYHPGASVLHRGICFSDRERELLEIVSSGTSQSDNKGFTLSGICRRATLPRRRVVYLLSLFVHWGIVEIIHGGSGFMFRTVE